MTNKLIFPFLFVFVASLNTYGQSFLNGDFEINTAVTDQINLTNSQYDSLMTNSTAFGNHNGGGVNGGNMDIITSNTFCGAAQNGNWYVALTSGGTDAISLSLSSSLIAGNTYEISFYDRSCFPYTAGSPIKIGVSTTNNTFGNLVFTAPTPVYNGGWTQRIFSFIAPISAAYITVTCDSINSSGPWTHVDNFTFTMPSSIQTIDEGDCIQIFPNPASNQLTIKINLNKELRFNIFNSLGQSVKNGNIESNSESIDISNLTNGIYSIELSSENKIERKFFIVENQGSR